MHIRDIAIAQCFMIAIAKSKQTSVFKIIKCHVTFGSTREEYSGTRSMSMIVYQNVYVRNPYIVWHTVAT